jgi:hypothetical protein
VHHRTIQINHQLKELLHQVGDLFELNVELHCQKLIITQTSIRRTYNWLVYMSDCRYVMQVVIDIVARQSEYMRNRSVLQ